MPNFIDSSKMGLWLLVLPSIVGMVLSICRVDEHISRPAQKRSSPRFCEIGSDDQVRISDPGGAAWTERPSATARAEQQESCSANAAEHA